MKQNPSPRKTQVIVVAALLGLGVIALIVLVLFAFRGNLQMPVSIPATPTQSISTLFAPTVDCGSDTLLLGTSAFQIHLLSPVQDGSLAIPADTSGVAYWLNGTTTNPVFVLSPTSENLAIMATVTVGSPAKVTLTNCNSTTYTLSAGEAQAFDASTLADQTTEGITIFFETDAAGAGFLFTGELAEQQISTINTAIPSSGVNAEVSLLETMASSDGTSIRVSVSIQNYGTTPFMLSTSDVLLTAQDGAALAIASSEPTLPKEITAGTIETFYFTFPRPTSPSAILKILNVEYDVDGY